MSYDILHDPIISIHALLAESDAILHLLTIGVIKFLSTLSLRRATMPFIKTIKNGKISIHALLAESDWTRRLYEKDTIKFLSTLSLRRATVPV